MGAHNIERKLHDAQMAIRDPGNAGTITVSSNCYVNIATAGVETRTIARPTRRGARVRPCMVTDGGDCTVTVTGGFNEDGDTTFVFTEVGQFFDLISYATSAGVFFWRKISDYGLGNISPADAAVLDELSVVVATGDEINRAADMSTRVVEVALAGSATLSITEALHDGKTIYVLKTDGWNATLPVPVAGMRFRIVIGATITVASTIKSVAGTQIMIGHALMGNDSTNAVVDWPAVAADTFDTINLLGTSNSTGGMAGQVITIEAMSSTVWLVEIRGDAAGTEATPFENTVA